MSRWAKLTASKTYAAHRCGHFSVRQGDVTFLKPVNGMVTGVVFVGEGHFNLKPVAPLDAADLRRRIDADEADEDFNEAVIRFTPKLREKFTVPGLKDREEPPPQASGEAFRKWRERMRAAA